MSVAQLEERLRRYLPLKHFLLTGYTRNGLYLFIKAMGWDAQAEIIFPAFTCPVIPAALAASGVKPIPADVEETGLNIDPDRVAEAITPHTKAIYVVHTYGHAAQIEKLCALAREHGLLIIEDLAHSLFSRFQGRPLGTFGDVALLSFTKKIINFEGGAVGTNDTAIYEKMLYLQSEHQRTRAVNFNDLRDYYVRLVGSWWESRFSLLALMIMKANDLVNDMVYKGSYGLAIDSARFEMHPLAARLTLLQLSKLYARDNTANYLRFKNLFQVHIQLAELAQTQADSLPAYYSGIPIPKRWLASALSFRTWHTCVENSPYPRARYLHERYRIFSRSIMGFFRFILSDR